jgi:hypothetical protein
MANALQAVGSHGDHDSGWAPIFTNRFFLGLWTNRNPLRAPTGVIYENYYRLGGTDALIGGNNVEISNRLTICRRPGNTAGLTNFVSSSNIPDIPDSFYSFHEIGGTIRVFADTPTAPYLIGGYTNGAGTASQGIIPIFTKGAGVVQSFFQGIGQSLYFSDTAEQEKWLDFGSGNPGNSFSVITATSLTSNVATITAINNFAIGQTVVISQTTNNAGTFNTTGIITAANSSQFQFALVHANISPASDTGFANACWNLGIIAPTIAPTLNIVASGAAAVAWQASTYFSTMGLVVDGNNNVQELISVNNTGTNTTPFGTSGDGQPQWSATPGATTSDNTVTWTNWGPIVLWTAHTTYSNHRTGGDLTNPAYVYDPVSDTIWGNDSAGGASGISGAAKPAFAKSKKFIADGSVNSWINVSGVGIAANQGTIFFWQPNHLYSPSFSSTNRNYNAAIIEPIALPAPSNQVIFFQVATTGGTSGGSGTPPFQNLGAATQTYDNDLIWLNLGSATWVALTNYTAWTGTQPVFSVIQDTNGNMQVCVVSGQSGATQAHQQWQANHAYSNTNTIVDTNGRLQTVTSAGTSGAVKTLTTSDITSGVATYTTSTNHGYAVGQQVTVVTSSHDSAFNVTNAIITSLPTAAKFTINLAHDDIVSAADTGTSYAGPTWAPSGTTTDGGVTWTAGSTTTGWGVNYGDTTLDGTAKWVCVGPPMAWAASTLYHLPPPGFEPPSPSQPFGGSEVISTGFVQATIRSGKSAASLPTFSNTIGNFTIDNPGASEIIWTNAAAFSQNSISWTKGYGYVYAYKARGTFDQYAPLPLGGGLNPQGSGLGTNPAWSAGSGGLTPTGSADGSVSTASPSVQMAVGINSGSVVNISGLGSTDPQVDTVSIFRTFDGGATFFWLTDIKNPQSIGGIAQPWTFQDFLPDIATDLFLGLNTLVLAPINHSNDPPLAGMINLTQYFGRIFYSVGATVYCSQGPNVGGPSQPPGNGYTAYNPGQFWTFTSPVTRLVPTTVGLLVWTTSDLGIIQGGPQITTLFNNIYVPGLGLTSFNALTVNGGLIDLFTADSQVVRFDPNMGVSKIGVPIGDQFFKYGAQTTTFSPATAYVTFHTQGLNDEALFVADGSTGWFRGVPNLAPDAAISGPVWSPKATVVGGCKAIQSLEVQPGQHALLIGATSANHPVLVRDSTYTTFTDNSSAYAANFIFGSMVLANPGQLAELGFITCEFIKTGTSPILSVMLDELADSVMVISAALKSGNNVIYTYTLTTGYAVVPGSGVTITGMADAANNGTFTVTAVGAGTFTVVNAAGVTRAVQTGAGTLFESLSGYVSAVTSLPPQDAPTVYGLQFTPASTYANRYYFAQSVNGVVPPQGVDCRHMQVKLDFGSSDIIQNELLTMSIFGKHWQEV